MKTVLFLLDRYPGYGGIEKVTTCLANSLTEQYKIILCSGQSEHGDKLLQQLDPRITYRALPHRESRYNSDNLTTFQRILKEEDVRLVIYQDSYAANEFLPLSIKKESGVKLIVAEHSSPGMSRRWLRAHLAAYPKLHIISRAKVIFFGVRGILRSLKRRTTLYQHCDKYILLSPRLRQEFLQNSFIRTTDKLDTISNPVSYTPQPVDLREKKKQVLFIGQFVPDKGISYLLSIWEKVAPQAPDWQLVLVGDGPDMNETKAAITRMRIPRVSIEGFRTDIEAYCRSASILCMCSSFEGFPMVLPEAMSSGAVPMSFNSFSAIDDIFTDEISGYKIPVFDTGTYAARLLELMQNDEKRERMARAAIAQSENFRKEHFIARWREKLEELLSSPRA